MICRHKPFLVGLFELKVSSSQADGICCRFGFEQWLRVEAVGFREGIWLFWKADVEVKILATYPQFVLLKVNMVLWIIYVFLLFMVAQHHVLGNCFEGI